MTTNEIRNTMETAKTNYFNKYNELKAIAFAEDRKYEVYGLGSYEDIPDFNEVEEAELIPLRKEWKEWQDKYTARTNEEAEEKRNARRMAKAEKDLANGITQEMRKAMTNAKRHDTQIKKLRKQIEELERQIEEEERKKAYWEEKARG